MSDDLVGTTVGHFELTELLGAGGMGAVYRAKDTKLKRTVAIKLMRPDLMETPDRRRRFMQEARAAGAVTHRNIAVIYEVGEHEVAGQASRVYIAMEHVSGESLRDAIARNPLDPDRVETIMGEVARALSAAHEAGIVHRDLKPDNIMLTTDGVKVLDFGVAKLGVDTVDPEGDTRAANASSSTAALTADGRLVGTPGYMSPEQVSGDPLDGRSDLFSLGVTAFEALTGHPPFSGRTTMDVLIATSRDAPPDVADFKPDAPEKLVAVVTRLLEKKPADRFSTANALIQAIRQDAAPSPVRAATPAARKPSLAWALPVLALVLGVAYVGLRGDPPETTPVPKPPVAAPTGVPITGWPDPKTASKEALKAYRAGLQGKRDGAWTVAHEDFKRAVDLDPDFAAAYVQLALSYGFVKHDRKLAKNAYDEAAKNKGDLGERDRALFRSLAPLITKNPADKHAHAAALAELIHRFPGDVEALTLRADALTRIGRPEAALKDAQQAEKYDPESADALEAQALVHLALGDGATAVEFLRRCGELSPRASWCRQAHLTTLAALGKCKDVMQLARDNPLDDRGGFGHYMRASVHAFDGAEYETIDNVLEQRLASWQPPRKDTRRAIDQAQVAALSGDFETVISELKNIEGLHDGSNWFGYRPLRLLLDAHVESGDPTNAAEEARIAIALLDKRPVEAVMQITPLPMLLRVAKAEDAGRKVADWQGLWFTRGATLSDLWLLHWFGEDDEVRIQAAAEDAPKMSLLQIRDNPHARAEYGNIHVVMKRELIALSYLRAATRDCRVLEAPIAHTRAFFDLGRVLEQQNEKEKACKAYKVVQKRWGYPTPRSITADKAKQRVAQLPNCDWEG